MVRITSLALAIVATLGLAAGPTSTLGKASEGSEALSALLTGTVLLLVAAVARRVPVRKD